MKNLTMYAANCNASRKRKMKEAVVETPPSLLPPPAGFLPPLAPAKPAAAFNMFQSQAPSSSQPPLQVPPHFNTALRLSNAAGGHMPPPRPDQGGDADLELLHKPIKSFTSLLNGDKDDVLSASLELQKDYIEQFVKSNSDRVKEMLEGMCMRQYAAALSAADERAAKKVKEKDEEMGRIAARNAELETIQAFYDNTMRRLVATINSLEVTNGNLRASLSAANRRAGAEEAPLLAVDEEDAQSSSVDPEVTTTVRMTCRNCSRRIAAVMPCPCRHLSLCKRCVEITNRCPVCEKAFHEIIEVNFSG